MQDTVGKVNNGKSYTLWVHIKRIKRLIRAFWLYFKKHQRVVSPGAIWFMGGFVNTWYKPEVYLLLRVVEPR